MIPCKPSRVELAIDDMEELEEARKNWVRKESSAENAKVRQPTEEEQRRREVQTRIGLIKK